MSYPADCMGCARGNHGDHQWDHGARPVDLIGGSVCECKGDCADRFAAFCDRMAAILTPVSGVAGNPDNGGEN